MLARTSAPCMTRDRLCGGHHKGQKLSKCSRQYNSSRKHPYSRRNADVAWYLLWRPYLLSHKPREGALIRVVELATTSNSWVGRKECGARVRRC